MYLQKWIFARVRAQDLTSALNFSSHLSLLRVWTRYPRVPPTERPLAARLHAPESEVEGVLHLKVILSFALRLLHKTSQITGSGDNQGNFRSALLI